jgi:hypothetical protein
LATGHYARVDWTEGGRTKLMRSADATKDQTYYLSSVPEAQLSRVSDLLYSRIKRSSYLVSGTGVVPTRWIREDRGSHIGREVRFAHS